MGNAAFFMRPPENRRLTFVVDRVLFQLLQRSKLQRRHVARFQHNLGRHAGIVCFFPTCGAQAPLITGLQSRKAIHWVGGRQVVTTLFAEFQKLCGHSTADNVQPGIRSARVATSITVKTCHWVRAASLQFAAQNIFSSNDFIHSGLAARQFTFKTQLAHTYAGRNQPKSQQAERR